MYVVITAKESRIVPFRRSTAHLKKRYWRVELVAEHVNLCPRIEILHRGTSFRTPLIVGHGQDEAVPRRTLQQGTGRTTLFPAESLSS